MKANLKFYNIREAEQFTFFRIPKLLFTEKRFSKISADAKILYGILLDRMGLSIKNGWVDEENHVYIYFKLEELMEYMDIGRDKGMKLFAELDDEKGCGLIKRKRRGLGKPTMIYVMNFTSADDKEDETDKEDIAKADHTLTVGDTSIISSQERATSISRQIPTNGEGQTPTSVVGKHRPIEVGKSDPNNNKYNKTNINNTYHILSNQDMKEKIDMYNAYENQIKENICYNYLTDTYGEVCICGVVRLITEAVCSDKTAILIGGEPIPQNIVKKTFLSLNDEHISYVLDVMRKNVTKIKNIKNYLLTAIYNSISTIDHYYRAEVNYDLYGGLENE